MIKATNNWEKTMTGTTEEVIEIVTIYTEATDGSETLTEDTRYAVEELRRITGRTARHDTPDRIVVIGELDHIKLIMDNICIDEVAMDYHVTHHQEWPIV